VIYSFYHIFVELISIKLQLNYEEENCELFTKHQIISKLKILNQTIALQFHKLNRWFTFGKKKKKMIY